MTMLRLGGSILAITFLGASNALGFFEPDVANPDTDIFGSVGDRIRQRMGGNESAKSESPTVEKPIVEKPTIERRTRQDWSIGSVGSKDGLEGAMNPEGSFEGDPQSGQPRSQLSSNCNVSITMPVNGQQCKIVNNHPEDCAFTNESLDGAVNTFKKLTITWRLPPYVKEGWRYCRAETYYRIIGGGQFGSVDNLKAEISKDGKTILFSADMHRTGNGGIRAQLAPVAYIGLAKPVERRHAANRRGSRR